MVKFKSAITVAALLFVITISLNSDLILKGSAHKRNESSYQAVNEKEYPVRNSITAPKQAKAEEKKENVKVSKVNESKKTVSTKSKSTASNSKTSGTKKAVAAAKKTAPQSRGGRKASLPANNIIDYAKQFLGVKYVFGGASPSGFDCSGFTMYVFKKVGINLPHSAKAQYAMGTPVSRDNLIPGDLVFFETYKKGISHVGIYIGDNKFIEASSSRGIAITSMSNSYYTPRYIGAVRIMK